MIKKVKIDKAFYGVATLGEKGQVVVPAEARKALNLKKGEKLLVFSFVEGVLVLSKAEGIEKFADHLSEQLGDINAIINKKNK